MTHRSALAAGATIVALGLATATAPGRPASPLPAKKITAAGVGKVKIGKRHRVLRRQRLVGRLQGGCPLGGGDTRSARLKRPLRGLVNYTLTNPRRVVNVIVTRGAKARGVGIGSTIAQIKDAFPRARVDRSTEEVFRITLVKIPRRGGGRIQFAVDVDTDRTTLIGVPFISFCE